MRLIAMAFFLGLVVGCAAEKEDDRVMIALVIENEMNRHILSCNVEFTPESGVHTFGNIIAGGSTGNLGFPVADKPTAFELTLYIAKQAGIDPMMVDGNTERDKVVRTVNLFEPKRNRANYPEYHLIIRSDGSVEQVTDIEEDEAEQRAADEKSSNNDPSQGE